MNHLLNLVKLVKLQEFSISLCSIWKGIPQTSILATQFVNTSREVFTSREVLNLIPSPLSSSPSAAAATAKSLQLCPTLCDPRDSSPPGSPVPGILQARTLEWVAIAFSPISCYQQEFWIRSPLQNLQFSSSIGLKQRASLSPLLDRETGDRASNLAVAGVEEWGSHLKMLFFMNQAVSYTLY